MVFQGRRRVGKEVISKSTDYFRPGLLLLGKGNGRSLIMQTISLVQTQKLQMDRLTSPGEGGNCSWAGREFQVWVIGCSAIDLWGRRSCVFCFFVLVYGYTTLHVPSLIYFFILLLYFNFFIEVQLIYRVVLIIALQQNDSVMHIYIYIYSFFRFFPIIVYYKILNIVPCAMQQDLAVCLFSIVV